MLTLARRSKKPEEHVNHERWLVTYADLITLLLAFFVIMYAMSKVDVNKYEVLAQSLSLQFKESNSILSMNSGVSDQNMPPKSTVGEITDKKTKERQAAAADMERKEKELQDILKTVQAYIEENHLEAQIAVGNSERGVSVTLKDLFLFDLGKAELKPEAYPVLNKLASLFPTLDTKISIEGHTDNIPVRTGSPFQDNWGLSNARSLSVLRYFTTKADPKISDSKFMSTGYADTIPVAPNDSMENRAKNRRVEIVILR